MAMKRQVRTALRQTRLPRIQLREKRNFLMPRIRISANTTWHKFPSLRNKRWRLTQLFKNHSMKPPSLRKTALRISHLQSALSPVSTPTIPSLRKWKTCITNSSCSTPDGNAPSAQQHSATCSPITIPIATLRNSSQPPTLNISHVSERKWKTPYTAKPIWLTATEITLRSGQMRPMRKQNSHRAPTVRNLFS